MKAAVIGTIMPWSGGVSEVPDGWIVCDGTTPDAKDYPLLVQVIGDTYNQGTSNLGGAFPAYTGQFVLPDLVAGKTLMDIEGSYFNAISGTGDPIDSDPDARPIIEPFIGENTDNGIPSVFNDVRTDVEFTLNDRNGYTGSITGNTIIDGTGEKLVFIAGRKLGNQHIRPHAHPGVYDTLQNADPTKPGLGVVPYDNITMKYTYASFDRRDLPNIFNSNEFDEARFSLRWFKNATAETETIELLDSTIWGQISSYSGAGAGLPGRTIMEVLSEDPADQDFGPRGVTKSSITDKDEFISDKVRTGRPYGGMRSGDVIPYGSYGSNYTIPVGQRNYSPAPDAGGDPAGAWSVNYGTFVSNIGSALDWQSTDIQAHSHDPISIFYDQASLKPQSRLTADVNIPVTTILDNVSNVGALEISMNTSQPSLTVLYIIRAY